MDPLRFTSGRTAYELDPDGIAKIEADDSPINSLVRAFRITFKCGGIMNVRGSEAVIMVEMWLAQSRFPLTLPPAPETEPDEAEAEPVNG